MTIEALDNDISVIIYRSNGELTGSFQIKLNDNAWTDILWSDIGSYNNVNLITATMPNKTLLSKGDKLQFRNIAAWSNADGYSSLNIISDTGDNFNKKSAIVYGSLAKSLTPEFAASILKYKFMGMFSGSSAITDVSKFDIINNITISDSCYSNMFSSCISLINAPKLPATTLVDRCYSNMFFNCKSLINAPKLPATTLAKNSYFNMFYNCSKITELHYQASMETNSTFTSMSGAPKFGAENASVIYDL